jgi:hypothetical protein
MWGPCPSLVTPVSSLPLTIPREGADILLRIPFHRITIIVSSTPHNCFGEQPSIIHVSSNIATTVDESPLSTFISHQRLAAISVNTTKQQMPTILDTRNGTGDKSELNLLICLLVCLVLGPVRCATTTGVPCVKRIPQCRVRRCQDLCALTHLYESYFPDLPLLSFSSLNGLRPSPLLSYHPTICHVIGFPQLASNRRDANHCRLERSSVD